MVGDEMVYLRRGHEATLVRYPEATPPPYEAHPSPNPNPNPNPEPSPSPSPSPRPSLHPNPNALRGLPVAAERRALPRPPRHAFTPPRP